MFKNYFKITWRNLIRQKLYTMINIGGLVIGLVCFLTIFLYVEHEFSYDQFYSNADKIHRIYQRQPENASLGTDLYAVTPAGLPSTLMSEYPEVRHATSVSNMPILFGVGQDSYLEDAVRADEHFFEVFPHEFIVGSANSALDNIESIVVTESFAKKVFGKKDVVGEKMRYWNMDVYVTGVIKDLPDNSSLQFACVVNIKSSGYYRSQLKKEKWNGNEYHTFFTIREGVSINTFQQKIQRIIEERWSRKDIPSEYLVQPISDMHLFANINDDIGIKGSSKQLLLFSVVAILVLILASINYMNLAIARSVNRAKEVGLRKAIGAQRGQLIIQFLGESVLLSFIALVLAIAIVVLFLPVFGNMVDRSLDLQLMEHLNLIPGLTLLIILIGVFSGSYPAVFMSSMKPVRVLKGKVGNSRSVQGLQKWLVVGQYTASIIMIICSLFIYQQFRYIASKELGFQKDHIIAVDTRWSVGDKIDLIKSQWLAHPTVKSVSNSSQLPTYIQASTFLKDDMSGGQIYRLYTDYDFLDVFEIKLLSGRGFSPDFANDLTVNYIINETAAKALGWSTESAVGQQFTNEEGHRKTVIGVIQDFHMHSMHAQIAPLMIGLRNGSRYLSIKVSPQNLNETIVQLEEIFKEHTSFPFDYHFMDDQFEELYKEDMRQAEIFGFFTILALIVASFGLFGLAAFNVHQRIREVGIRKVLGASVQSIVAVFAKDFLLMVVIAFVIAVPVSWYATHHWLQDFAYRIDIQWWTFALAGLGAVVIAFITISSQSIKAAISNPVNCLHDE